MVENSLKFFCVFDFSSVCVSCCIHFISRSLWLPEKQSTEIFAAVCLFRCCCPMTLLLCLRFCRYQQQSPTTPRPCVVGASFVGLLTVSMGSNIAWCMYGVCVYVWVCCCCLLAFSFQSRRTSKTAASFVVVRIYLNIQLTSSRDREISFFLKRFANANQRICSVLLFYSKKKDDTKIKRINIFKVKYCEIITTFIVWPK